MLPSMPLISTPFKEEPSPLPATLATDTPCLPPVTPPDPGGIDMSTVKQDRINSPTGVEVVTIADCKRETETTPPGSCATSPCPANYLSVASKKSSPLKLVNPILKKYNSHRQGKILKRSVSPMHGSIHLTFAQTYLHSERAETRTHAETVDSEADLAALMVASSTVPRQPRGKQAPVNKKKRLKELRDAKVMLALLAADSEQYRAENAKSFAQAYCHKLRERLEENYDGELFRHVLQLLGEFEAQTTPVKELYERVVDSLRGYPDLAELFNLFLLPEQAKECGKFMEYLKLANMKTFVRKLEVFFAKQPQQFRQVLSTLTALTEQPNVTMTDVKSAVLPLLKSNAFLVDSFLFLFPEERPPDSLMADFEEMEVDSDQSGDEGERVGVPDDRDDPYGTDGCVCPCHSSGDDKYAARQLHCLSCGTKFIHGKVYVHMGRALRPAKVTFPGHEAARQRIYVKANRRARPRKNPSGSPTKTPTHVCDEATDDDAKSSSPKACKIAKIKPANKVRTIGSKPGFKGEPGDSDAENKSAEVSFGEVIANSATSDRPITSAATFNAETIALAPFGSADDSTCDDNLSIGSDIDFYAGEATATVDTPLESLRAVEFAEDSDRLSVDAGLPRDLSLPVTPTEGEGGVDSALDATDGSVDKTEADTDFLSSSLPLDTYLVDPATTVSAVPDTSKNGSTTSLLINAPVNTAVTSEALISPIQKNDDATFVDTEVESTITTVPKEDCSTVGPNSDCSVPSAQTAVPAIALVLIDNCVTLSLGTSDRSTLTIPNVPERLTFPQQTNDLSALVRQTTDSFTLADQTNNSSMPIGSNAECLTLPGQTNYPSTSVSPNADCLTLPGQTNYPSTSAGSNAERLPLPGQTNDRSTLIVSNANCLTSIGQSADCLTLPAQLNDPSTTAESLTLYRGTDSSTPASPSVESLGQTYDCLTLTVENNYPDKEGSIGRDDVAQPEAKSSPRAWTREEDRLILVEVQLGFGMDETFVNIKRGLPHRDIEEIRERFHMLMKILQEMTDPKEGTTKSSAASATV